jgi:hypothetical protein
MYRKLFGPNRDFFFEVPCERMYGSHFSNTVKQWFLPVGRSIERVFTPT